MAQLAKLIVDCVTQDKTGQGMLYKVATPAQVVCSRMLQLDWYYLEIGSLKRPIRSGQAKKRKRPRHCLSLRVTPAVAVMSNQ